MPVDVQDIAANFSMRSPVTSSMVHQGSGAIYIHPERMAEMRPFSRGGDMTAKSPKTAINLQAMRREVRGRAPRDRADHRYGCRLE